MDQGLPRAGGGRWCLWRATAAKDGRLYFHAWHVPVCLWAVSIQPAGVIWADAEIVRITGRNVIAHYAEETARLSDSRG